MNDFQHDENNSTKVPKSAAKFSKINVQLAADFSSQAKTTKAIELIQSIWSHKIVSL